MVERMLNVFNVSQIILLVSFLQARPALAERYRGAPERGSRGASGSLKTKTAVQAPDSKAIGGIELRPGVETSEGAVNSENSVWIGMDFRSWDIRYVQDIDTAATNTDDSGTPIVQDGHVKVRLMNLWTDGSTSFSNEFRAYVPTNSAKREKGFTTAFRNYFILEHKLSSVATLFVTEVPIILVYSEPGSVTASGPEANPGFQNRLIFGASFKLSDSLTLSAPLHLYSTKYRDYAPNAKLNDEWDPELFFWPEVYYTFKNSPFYVGAALRTNNLMKVTEQGTESDFNSTFQGILGVAF